MNRRLAIGIGVGAVLLIGGGLMAYSYSKNKRRKGSLGASTDDDLSTDPSVSRVATSSGGSNTTSTPESTITVAPPVDLSKKETVSLWKSDKDRIKAICGRRRISGKKKKEWLACVAKHSSFAGESFHGFEGSHIEIELPLTEIY